jgi:hypothetical protein
LLIAAAVVMAATTCVGELEHRLTIGGVLPGRS